MTEKEKKKILEKLKADITVFNFSEDKDLLKLIENQQEGIEEEHKKWKELLHEYGIKCQEIEELKKVIKMVEIYKSNGIPEDVEMVIMRKDDFLRNNNNEYISKDKIKELIEQLEDVLDLAESEKRFPKYRKQALIEEIRDLQELLEE